MKHYGNSQMTKCGALMKSSKCKIFLKAVAAIVGGPQRRRASLHFSGGAAFQWRGILVEGTVLE